jgi:hypothetical protein
MTLMASLGLLVLTQTPVPWTNPKEGFSCGGVFTVDGGEETVWLVVVRGGGEGAGVVVVRRMVGAGGAFPDGATIDPEARAVGGVAPGDLAARGGRATSSELAAHAAVGPHANASATTTMEGFELACISSALPTAVRRRQKSRISGRR